MRLIKNNEKEIELIKKLEICNMTLISSDSSISYQIYKSNKNFTINTNKKVSMENSKFKNENLNNEEFYIYEDDNKMDIKILSSMINSSSGVESKFKVQKLCTKDFNNTESLYYKLIIPHNEELKINYEDRFEREITLFINGSLFSGIEFNINESVFHFYHIKEYLVIEIKNKIDFVTFDKYCRQILASFGYINDFVPMDYGYYFNYQDIDDSKYEHFLYTSDFYGTYKSSYKLISLNSYEYLQSVDLKYSFDERNRFIEDERIKEINKELKPITREIFEKLISLMLEKDKFNELIYSLLSINNLTSFSIFLKSGLYSIALEMITSIITTEEKEKKKDEGNLIEELSSNQKTELNSILDEVAKKFFNDNNLTYNNSVVKNRIEAGSLYNPFNSTKLTEPYDILGIKLTEKDKKNIKLRNLFLHGTIPFYTKDITTIEHSKILFCINLELYYLVNALILKYIGFDGILKDLSSILLDKYDFPKIKDKNTSYYRKLSI